MSKRHERLDATASTRVQELTSKLLSDDSPLALRPADPERLASLVSAHIEAASTVPAAGTLDADATGWKRWETYCDLMGTLAVQSSGGKSPFGDISAADRESILQSGFLIYLAGIIEPRSKASAAAKPQSGFNNLPALRRVQHRMMMDFVIYKAASLTLKAQVKAFIRDNGTDALVPARKEPLDANGLRQILALEPG